MIAPRLILKQPTGWFAAGREFAQALTLLSDGAFKLYVYICLNSQPPHRLPPRYGWRVGAGHDKSAKSDRHGRGGVGTAGRLLRAQRSESAAHA